MRCVEVVEYHTERPSSCTEEWWNVYVEFSDGQIIGFDFVIEALGVTPNSSMWKGCCKEVDYTPDLIVFHIHTLAHTG